METNALVQKAELELLAPALRQNSVQVRDVLHPNFVEIGRSGKRWTRELIIADLLNEVDRDAPVTAEWDFVALSDDLTLVTYLIRGTEHDSRHSSLWDTSSGQPIIRFHQGTIVAEKSSQDPIASV